LFQVGFFNLVGQGVLQPHPRPERPPFQPRQIFSNVHVPAHVSLQPEVPINDGWQEVVHQPAVHHNGWPVVSLPLPPPPPLNQHAQQIDHVISPVQSSHASSSKESSNSVTSHAQQNDAQSPVFSEIQPQGSNQPLVERDKSTDKVEKVASSEKRQTASHNKYGF
jgi:hypothetical protein